MERDHTNEIKQCNKRSHKHTMEDEMKVLDKKFKDQKHNSEQNAESQEKELTTALKRRLDKIQTEMEDKENKLLNEKRKRHGTGHGKTNERRNVQHSRKSKN